MKSERRIILLGPQPRYESLNLAIERLQIKGPVALITAGWEEDEPEDGDLKSSLSVPAVNLRLFARTEQLFTFDRELIQQLQNRQDELRHLRDAYRIRLKHALASARDMFSRQDPLIDLDPERESAIEMVRILDRQYFLRTSQVVHDYEKKLQIASRPLVIKHRREVQKLLHNVEAILISGGHAAIILNRLRFFNVCQVKRRLPIIAWSGGAMALAEQIVFFHDHPPQGSGNPEVLRAGLGMVDRILPLPDARARLDLNNPIGVTLFARRFDRFNCVVLDERSILDRMAGHWWFSEGTEKLDQAGRLAGLNT
ncbi:MAG TPA: hypothetical protein PKD64_08135 [Pirellulaceae bacterium]|nr:hypothetical protein [Pirellulaceae bacterium]HMO92155.1 hypothetical protein [Pirellulaceae bacterium]HMP68919.1 hypothetical protein [Pirellulaceae bacterium]